MKSTYELQSAEELSPQIIEAIKTSFGKKAIRITIEEMSQTKKENLPVVMREEDKKLKEKQLNAEMVDEVVGFLFNQIAKKTNKK